MTRHPQRTGASGNEGPFDSLFLPQADLTSAGRGHTGAAAGWLVPHSGQHLCLVQAAQV